MAPALPAIIPMLAVIQSQAFKLTKSQIAAVFMCSDQSKVFQMQWSEL
jgi:hypothetical protein